MAPGAMMEQITRKDQPHAWVVFEKKTGLFQAFFFDRALAEKFVGRHPDTLEMQEWVAVSALPGALTFKTGQRVRKKSGSSWQGRIVGVYRTSLTPEGYCVESEREPGSVQIYPAKALEAVDD